MKTAPIIEDLHVIEDGGTGLVAVFEHPVMNELVLQATEEALCHRVVQAVALAAHALHKAMRLKQGQLGSG